MSGATFAGRVLIVTSSYAPTTIADLHRARHLAWELPKLGWEVEILCPNREFQRIEYLEPNSETFFNSATLVHEVAPVAGPLFRALQVRSIGWRALLPLYKKGRELLATTRFDVIYISTANFVLFCLGPLWARKSNVPYVLDFHDPWVRDHVRYQTTKHRVKQKIGAALSRSMERAAIRRAASVVSVSPVYIAELRERYGNLDCLGERFSMAIPFAAREEDCDVVAPSGGPDDNEVVISYVGAGGAIMAKSFSTICAILGEVRKCEPGLFGRLKIRLDGTYAYWTPGQPKPLFEIAVRFGLGDVVEENPARVTYRKSLESVSSSDGLLILGVDDDGYMPSKLFPYALSGKPLLACFRSGSPPVKFFQKSAGLGRVLTFRANGDIPTPTEQSKMVVREFLMEVNHRDRFERKTLLHDVLAPSMAQKHVDLFENVRIPKR